MGRANQRTAAKPKMVPRPDPLILLLTPAEYSSEDAYASPRQ